MTMTFSTLKPAASTGALATTRRVVAALWLAVFGFVVGGIPVADAMVGHAQRVAAHWEDSGDRDCPPQHDASACQLCQVHASARRSETAPLVVPVAVAFSVSLPETILLAAIDADQGGIPDPRGPPVG
jgi:hypothetical protein